MGSRKRSEISDIPEEEEEEEEIAVVKNAKTDTVTSFVGKLFFPSSAILSQCKRTAIDPPPKGKALKRYTMEQQQLLLFPCKKLH